MMSVEWRKVEEASEDVGVLFDLMRDVSTFSEEEIGDLRTELSNQVQAGVEQVVGDAEIAYDLPVYVADSRSKTIKKCWGLTVEVFETRPFSEERSIQTFLRVCRRVQV